LESRLSSLPPEQRIAVTSGRVTRFSDDLETRILEQTVRLDDLARSVGGAPWSMPDDAVTRALRVGVEIGLLRFAGTARLCTMFRDPPFPGVLLVF
jgi:hypothetical protein